LHTDLEHVDPGVITGDSPIPLELFRQAGVPAAKGQFNKSQFNVRVNAAIRNAYELAARRYGLSTTTIVQLAPLLFVIMAEESLQYRREKLTELQTAQDRRDELESTLSYLPTRFAENSFDLLLAEKESIETRDLFGERLAAKLHDYLKYSVVDWAYDDAQYNPFETYLREMATPLEEDVVSVDAVGPTSNEYRICRTTALELVGNDFNAAESLLYGRVAIDKKSFRNLKTVEERATWIRENQGETEELSDRSAEEEDNKWVTEEEDALASFSL
jgi:hypothetical protein